MIKVDTYKHIKDLHIKERKSIRQISKDTGLSRQTIRKILYASIEEATNYKRKASPHAPLKEAFMPIIRQWAKENLNAPRKQQYKASRIFERLQEEHGFTGGESTVRGWFREIKQELNIEQLEAVLPLEHDPVGYAQCDWTPVLVNLNGEEIHGELFLLRLSYSKKFFARFYPHQRQEAFFDAHEQAFRYFGGIPQQILYDNLKTAVKKVLVGRAREEQDTFIKFRAHHGFDSQFCNPAKGNEKGGVEGLAKYLKWHIFTPVPTFPDIDALNHFILEKCEKLNNKIRGKEKTSFQERFEEEKSKLLPLTRHTFDCCARKEAKVNRFSLLTFDKNEYSVPVELIGKTLTVKGYVNEVRIYQNQTLITTHQRSYKTAQQYFKLEHYLKLLQRKPRGVGQAKPVRQAGLPPIFAAFHKEAQKQYSDQGDKLFVKILLSLKRFSVKTLALALEEALNKRTISAEDVENLADNQERKTKLVVIKQKQELQDEIKVAPPRLERYASLKHGGVNI